MRRRGVGAGEGGDFGMLNLLLALIVVDTFVLDLVTLAMSICDDVVCCGSYVWGKRCC